MRILILTLGSRGDVQPYVALGAAMRAHGHDVVLSTGRGFEELIEARGLTAAPFSIDFRQLIELPEIQQAIKSVPGAIKALRVTKGLVRRQFDEMWALARDLRPDLIVYHPKAFVAADLAEALQGVAVPTALMPAFVPTGAFPSPLLPFSSLGRFGNRLSHQALLRLMPLVHAGMIKDWRRSQLGLTHGRPRDPFNGYDPRGRSLPRLHGYSRQLVPVPDDWSDREQVTGYWFLDQTDDWEPPEDLANFLGAGPAPVYVGFGSMPGDAKRLTRIVRDALRSSGQRGVLATGWGGLEHSDESDQVYVLDSIPHDWLFPRCAAVVHHGGAGTTHEALRWGRPSIVCPVFGDQPFWGRRVKETGAGPAPLPQKHMTSEALARALDAAQNPAILSRAAEIGAAMRAEPGAEGAASVIDSIALA